MALSRDNHGLAFRLLSLACILLVSLTTLVDVAHGHDLSTVARGDSVRSTAPVGSPHATCLLCVSVHSPALASAIVSAGPVALQQSRVLPDLHGSHSHQQSFALSVRPPPQA